MLFLRMVTFFKISKRAGKHIDMNIKWDDYIAAATSKLRSLAFNDPDAKLSTLGVAKERMDAASLLEHLRVDVERPIIIGDKGFLVPIRTQSEAYVVLYRFDGGDELNRKVEEVSHQLDVTICEYIDAFFFFLVKELDIRLPACVTKEEVEAQIRTSDAGKSSMDFDDVINFHGAFFSYKVTDSICSVDFMDLLTWEEVGQHSIGYGGDDPEFGIGRLKSSNESIQVLDLRKLCRSIIKPIASAADKEITHASISLQSADQLGKALMSVRPDKDGVVFGPGGGVCFKFVQEGQEFLALSLRNFHEFEVSSVLEALTEIGVCEVEFECTHFMSFVHAHGQYLDIARERLSRPKELENALDLKSTLSVALSDVISVYEDVRVFEFSESPNSSPWAILCHLAARFKMARSPFIPQEIIEVSQRLLLLPFVPYENIYLALSASHWKHSFIEIYRVVEGLYYFGWMYGVRRTFGGGDSEYELYLKLQNELSWKYNERASIAKLFEIIPRRVLANYDPVGIESLSAKFENKEDVAVMKRFANLIYSIRNANVHQGESDEGPSIEVSADCWPKLTCCLFLIVEHLYSDHGPGMPRAPVLKHVAD